MKRDPAGEIKEMLAASRRSLALLDRRYAELAALVAEEDRERFFEDEKRYPYFYGAIGDDGEPGLRRPTAIAGSSFGDNDDIDATASGRATNEVTGTIQIQADAPFVCTHLMAVVTDSFTDFGEPRSILGGMNVRGTDLQNFSVQLGFIDQGSGRVLFQAETENLFKGGGELLEAEFFDTYRQLFPSGFTNGDPISGFLGVPGVYSQGHGPSACFEVTTETVLPASGTVEVRARNFSGGAVRLFVALGGYKLFEGG